MKNPLFNMKSVIKGIYKANVLMSEPELELEPEHFESQSRSGNKKFQLHNIAMKKTPVPY
jgi:hypothetical protein